MAVLLYISCKQFKKALDILADMNNMNNCELAYNFLNICLKHKTSRGLFKKLSTMLKK